MEKWYTPILSKTTQKINEILIKEIQNLPESLMKRRANPESNSRAANETFKSVRHEEIKRWQTKYVACTNRAWALSGRKMYEEALEGFGKVSILYTIYERIYSAQTIKIKKYKNLP